MNRNRKWRKDTKRGNENARRNGGGRGTMIKKREEKIHERKTRDREM
jgi:hypothetical protein